MVGQNPPELVAARRPERERLANRKRAHDQLIVRRDDVDVDGTAQKPPQPQQKLVFGPCPLSRFNIHLKTQGTTTLPPYR